MRSRKMVLTQLSFVFFVGAEGDEVEHLSHAAADAVAVVGFYFGGGEVGGDVGFGVFGDE